jgi:hypothetical protein
MPTSKSKSTPPKQSGKRIEAISKGRGNTYRIDEKDCVIDEGFNTRIDYGDLTELKDSIKVHGIIEVLYGYVGDDGKFHLDDGHRRLRAVRELKAEGFKDREKLMLPIRPSKRRAAEWERTVAMLLHGSGKPLDMYEQALAMKRLVDDYQFDKARIVEVAGYTIAHVDRCLQLADCAPDLQEAIRRGEISATLASDIVREFPGINAAQVDILNQGRQASRIAGNDRITAKHLPIETGKEAQKTRKEAASTDPFEGKESTPDTATTDEHGYFATGVEKIALPLKTKGIRQPEIRVVEHSTGRWYYGLRVAWPSVVKEGGWYNEAPNINGQSYPSRIEAVIAAMQYMRALLQDQDFVTKPKALEELDLLIAEAIKKVTPQAAAPHTQGAAAPDTAASQSAHTQTGAGSPSSEEDAGEGEEGQEGEHDDEGTGAPPSSSGGGGDGILPVTAPAFDRLKQVISAIPRAEAVKERYDIIKRVLPFLKGTEDARLLTRYIMGIDD